MKRFDEKVKDIVEVRSSSALSDFLAEPADTLAGYHFTDITSDLMAKWLDRVAGVKKKNGVALALAGFRGVGKSHFLAALGAIVSRPELRAGISDQHVAATAQRLSRRHGLVIHVRRGSGETLLEELKSAVYEASAAQNAELGDSISDLMALSAAKSGDLPPVFVIDTAFGRQTRVKRDDGLVLSEIAGAAKELGIFVGLALDDDIAGADGLNSSIAGSFEIDYLDQEHLYKIVNAYVFAKNDARRPLLQDIYESYRKSMPGFRWSETRFTSLYPLHPAIVEIAPFVRLYLQEFALLGFASEAGVKIMGRPANSLIGLDEVFDNIEERLRHVSDLKATFEAFDSIDRDVIAKAPVMQRHEWKLVLKGVFLLSLTGEGVTASELAASMMIFNEQDTSAAASNVETVLGAFASAMPDSFRVSPGSSGPKYLLAGGSEGDINSALESAIAKVATDVVWPILRRQTAEKFADLMPAEHDPAVSAKCNVVWRGGIRRGQIVWTGDESAADKTADWHVYVATEGLSGAGAAGNRDPSVCEWRLGTLSADDINTIKRFHVLQTDTEFREKFRDSLSTVLHVHLIAVEKVWQRVFLEDGFLFADSTHYSFSEEARGSHTLTQLFTLALDDHFAKRFPDHPEFGEVLQERQVSQLVEHLFSGSAPATAEIQKLAQNFAAPLGLVAQIDGISSLLGAAEIFDLPIVKTLLADVPAEKDGLLRIEDLSMRMQQPPFGLTNEAQHLVLAALVAQKQFEFVTSNGNRISQRSLDLQIVWDDIVGIAQPSEENYSNERLVKWVGALTGDRSLKGVKNSKVVTEVLCLWLDGWRASDVIGKFDRLPDSKLSTRIWRLGVGVKKTFGAAAEAVDALVNERMSFGECLQAIGESFCDSDDEYEAKSRDLEQLTAFLERAAVLDEINDYLLLCEAAGVLAIDEKRAELLQRVAAAFNSGDDIDAIRTEFASFRDAFTDWYAERHQAVMSSSAGQLDEYLATNAWATFSDLAATGFCGSHDRDVALSIVRKVRSLKCTADIREKLKVQPHCDCTFGLPDGRETQMLVDELSAVVEAGLHFFRDALTEQGTDVSSLFNEPDRFSAAEMQALTNTLKEFPPTNDALPERRRPTRRQHAALHPDDLREIEDELDRLA